MRVSKRKTLKVDDLNQSLKFFNFKVNKIEKFIFIFKGIIRL